MRLRLLAFALVACVAANAQSSKPTLAITHVNVITMENDRLLHDQTVFLTGDRITRIVPARSAHIPDGTRSISGLGKFLIPGLTDAHVHLESTVEFNLYLANGITTVFNLEGRPSHLLWRKQVAAGELLGPTIFTTGPIFIRSRTPEQDVALVDEQAAAGYDAVKIYNFLTTKEYPALIAEAKRKNMLIMGHIARQPGFEMTINSGQSIAHLEEIPYTAFNPQNDDNNSHIVFDYAKIPTITHQLKASGVSLIATLDNFRTIVQQGTDLDTFLKNPELKYDSPWTLSNLQPATNRYLNSFPKSYYPTLHKLLDLQRALLKSFSDAGVPILAGTDSTSVGPVAGFGLHHELQEFVRDGLTPYQALQTATVNTASYLRSSSEFGTITPGKRADLILLNGNPLLDIAQTQNIAAVVVRGRLLDKPELASMLAALPGLYAEVVTAAEAALRTDPARAIRDLQQTDPVNQLTPYAIAQIATTDGPDGLIRILTTIRTADPASTFVSEAGINTLGYAMLARKLFPQAIAVLAFNTQNFPQSANAWDSLAEAHFTAGDVPTAVQTYQHALDVNPTYPNAAAAKKFIADHPQK